MPAPVSPDDGMIADWQKARLPADAIPIKRELPPNRQEVLGWVSDKSVAIYYHPLVVWRITEENGHTAWWGGLPGNYLDLNRLRWKVTHWCPINTQGASHES
jgi:hypothetical protein